MERASITKGLALVLGLWALFFVLAGCGGGGGGSSSSGGSPDTRLAVFFTDNLSAGYDGVWVKVHKVEVKGASTGVTVFDSAAGEVVNLRALGSAAGGRFLFIAPGSLPAGTYTSVEIELDKSLSLYPTGAASGTPAVFADSLDAGAGRSKLRLNLTPPLAATGGAADLVVDFDLAAWTVAGGVVTPVVRRHGGEGLDDLNRHESNDFKGTVDGLTGTAPNQMFELVIAGGQRIKVKTTSATRIFLEEGGAFPLANAQLVEVDGVFDILTQSLTALEIKKEDGIGGQGEQKVKGAATEANGAAGTFKLSGSFVRGFVPASLPVTVAVTPTTSYLADNGAPITKEAFFAGLAGGQAEAEGTYAAASNTLTARKVKLEDEDEHLEAEGRGVVGGLDKTAGTFNLTLEAGETEGFTPPTSGVIAVATNGGTSYKNDAGVISRAAFFEQVANGKTVKVNGTYSGGVFSARKAELRD